MVEFIHRAVHFNAVSFTATMTVACSYRSNGLGFPIILAEETVAVVHDLDHSETEVKRRLSRDNFATG